MKGAEQNSGADEMWREHALRRRKETLFCSPPQMDYVVPRLFTNLQGVDFIKCKAN